MLQAPSAAGLARCGVEQGQNTWPEKDGWREANPPRVLGRDFPALNAAAFGRQTELALRANTLGLLSGNPETRAELSSLTRFF